MLKRTFHSSSGTRHTCMFPLVLIMFMLITAPVMAQGLRDFEPLPRGEIYETQFLDDFYTELGYRPEGLTWIDESETVRLLVTASVEALDGNYEEALLVFDMLPSTIARAFPFLTTMHEDLLVPEIIDPWYEYEDARENIFNFYEDYWLPNPQYRDDYQEFRDDTMGRASRLDDETTTAWILNHLSDYGFVADRAVSEDDPYLFLWDLCAGLTVYVQRANYYGVEWDRYFPEEYERAVVRHVGQIIHDAHDYAARQELGRGFWSDLIESHHPFETPAEAVESTGEVGQVTATGPFADTPTTSTATETVSETDVTNASELFQVPDEPVSEDSDEIEELIDDLTDRIQGALIDGTSSEDEPQEEPVPDESVTEPPTEPVPDETSITEPVEEPGELETPTEPIEDVPDEPTPSELQPEGTPPGELSDYAEMRLEEIADQLAVDIGALATDLGSETIDLVVLYNDTNVTEDTIVNAEHRYVAKREAFLAGLAVWDTFDMEIFTPLTLADFNDLVITDLNEPYDELKASSSLWNLYSAYEQNFIDALGQIEDGVRNRRDQEAVLEAEAAALTAFLGDYNDLIKEIEDLIAGVITEPPPDDAVVEVE